MMFYIDLFKELQSRKVQYLIAGGLAVNLHHVPRVTFDVDLVIAMDHENIMSFLQAMENLGYVPRLPVKPELLCDPAVVNHLSRGSDPYETIQRPGSGSE